MTAEQIYRLSIPLNEITLHLFPDTSGLETEAFVHAITARVREVFANLNGVIQSMTVSETQVQVTWKPDGRQPDFVGSIGEILKKGQYLDGSLLLELFLSNDPDNTDLLYNLGMAYSDQNILDRAVTLLTQLVQLAPDHINAHVALGVALLRQGKDEEGVRELELAVKLSPENIWARRDLGVGLIRLGRFAEAESHLLEATKIDPKDQSAWFGYGQALEALGKVKDADQAYIQAIQKDEFSQVAELARKARSKFAQESFRSVTPGTPRMDAVMYCLNALQVLEGLSLDQVKKIGIEIALLGTRGFDINNPQKKYTIKALPGEFSGLQLLCIEYVAFKKFAPGQDIGFDIGTEYNSALKLFEEKDDDGGNKN